MSSTKPSSVKTFDKASVVQNIASQTTQQLAQCKTTQDLRKVARDLMDQALELSPNKKKAKHGEVTAVARVLSEVNSNTPRLSLDDELKKVRKAIAGKFRPKLKSKTSKMKVEVPLNSLEIFGGLCNISDVNSLSKKGAYYEMQLVLPNDLLPDHFDPSTPYEKRFWYAAIDPETGYCKTTYGHPKSLDTTRPCELRYKPSAQTLSVTAWNTEIRSSWESLCSGRK